jgi:hypothetical protein
MSAVVEFVQDVGKAVGNVVEAVGDAVEKVGEVIVDTVKYVAENPEIIVIAVAAPYAIAAAGAAVGASAATISLVTQPITAAAISASQGGDLEDIGKAALGAYIAPSIARPVAAATGSAIGTGSAAQVALANAVGGAVGSAAGAAAVGTDIGEAALLGAAGSAGASLARSGAAELGIDETGKAAGFTADIGEAIARGSITGDIGGELVGAGIGALAGEGQQALRELTTPTIKNATAYYPPISPEMAALTGSTIDGSPVTDVPLVEGSPKSALMFPEGDMVVSSNAKTGSIYTVKNEQGETFQARDVTYQDGTVKRIIFDPNTQQYQQQVLKQPSIDAGGDRSLPGITVEAERFTAGEDARTGRVTDIAKAATGGRETTAPAGGAATAPAGGAATAPTPPAGPETGGTTAGDRGEGEMVGDGEREMAGGTRPVEDMTGNELLGDAMAGEEGGAPREGGGGGRGAGEGGGGGEGLAEQPADLEAMTDEELLALLEDSMDFDVEETPLVPPDDIGEFQPLDARTAGGSRRGTPYQSSISARAVGSSPTAAIVGNKEPIFGGDEGVQSEAWNTRSLRLRKALGI